MPEALWENMQCGKMPGPCSGVMVPHEWPLGEDGSGKQSGLVLSVHNWNLLPCYWIQEPCYSWVLGFGHSVWYGH